MKCYYAVKENRGKLELWICLGTLYEQIKNSIYCEIPLGLGRKGEFYTLHIVIFCSFIINIHCLCLFFNKMKNVELWGSYSDMSDSENKGIGAYLETAQRTPLW